MKNWFLGIDAQNDFIDGALPNQEAQGNVHLLNNAAKLARKNGFQVVWTYDTHGNEAVYLNTLEGKKLPVPHCRKHTHGWELHPAIEKEQSDFSMEKGTFGSTSLPTVIGRYIMDEGLGAIIAGGYDTDICGISNMLILRAAFPDTPIYWLAFASAATTSAMQEDALSVMHSCQIDVVETYAEYEALINKLKED